MKRFILILAVCIGMAGCEDKPPTVEQSEIVEQLIQQNIDIPYQEPNWKLVKEKNLLKGETIKEASVRSKRIYEKIHNFLLQLKAKPYKKKKTWAIKSLTIEVELLEGALKASLSPQPEITALMEKKKRWLKIIEE